MPFNLLRVAESTVRLTHALNAMPSMTWCADVDGLTTFASQKLLEFTGRRTEDFLGFQFAQLVHPDDRARVLHCWDQARAHEHTFQCEFRLQRADGQFLWVCSEASRVLGEDGVPAGWIGTCTLIHGLKVAHHRTLALQGVGEVLPQARRTPDLVRLILREAVRATDATGARVALVRPGEPDLAVVAAGTGHLTTPYVPMTALAPESDAVRAGQALFVPSQPDVQRIYPSEPVGVQALATLPLWVDGEAVGALTLHFAHPRAFDEAERAFLLTLARQCAQALERVQLTEQDVQARQALQQANATLNMFFESVPSGITVFDPDLRFIRVNAAAAHWNGRPEAAHVGRTLDEVIPDLAPLARPALQRVLDSGRPEQHLVRMPEVMGQADGVWEVTAHPLRDPEGRTVGVAGMFADVTAREATQAAARRSEARFRSLAQATGQLVWAITPDGTMTDFQDGWVEFTGITADDLAAGAWLTVVHPDDQAHTVRVITDANVQRAPYSVEHRIRRVDGAYRLMQARAFPILDGQGGISEWVGVHVDVTDQRAADVTLRDSEQRYRTLFEAMPNILWSATAGGQVMRFNHHWTEFTGLSAEPDGLSWLDAIHPDDLERILAVRAAGLSACAAYEVDARIRRVDGTYRWHEVRVAPYEDPAGPGDIQWLGYAVHIHDRVMAEATLAQSEARYRSLVNALGQMVWTTPADGVVRGPLADWAQYTGQTTTESLGNGWLDSVHPDDRERTWAAWQEAIRTGSTYVVEHRVRAGDGTWRWFQARAVPVKEGEQVREWVGVHTDIHARRAAEEALQALNASLEARVAERSGEVARLASFNEQLLTSIGQGIFGLDREGLITFANPEALRLTGFTLEEIQGQRQHDLIHHTHADGTPYPWTACPIGETGRTGQPCSVDDEVFWRKDGTCFPVAYTASPLLSPAGDLEGTVVTFTDITVRKKADQALRDANEELRRSNQDLEEFAFVASHDLQEPLRSIASFTDLLARQVDTSDPKVGRAIGYVQQGVRRMKAVITDLLQFSRVRGEAQERGPVDLERVMAQVRAGLEEAVTRSGAVVTWDALPTVQGDAAQLQQVLQNLLANALKFARPGVAPQVHVQAVREGRAWHVTVQDNGIGIEAQYFERIFKVFQRLHRHDQYDGTGIGLAVVARVVQRHGGRVWVTSTPGEGSAFHFTLPDRP